MQQLQAIPVTNREFLEGIFRENWPFAHVTAFPDDPNAIEPARRGICWSGDHYRAMSDRIDLGLLLNIYFCISLFSMADGRAVRRKDNFLGMYCLVADDVKDKIPQFLIEKLPPPSWILETSPGNEQWGWILTTPETNRQRAENLSEGLIRMGLAPDGRDPGMRGVTRYVRMPEGYNTKAKYGGHYKCRMLLWEPNRTTTIEALAAPFGVDLDGPGEDFEWGERALWPEDAPVMQWLAKDGNLLEDKGEGKYLIRCPRVHEHTNEDDSGTLLVTNKDGDGGFRCHHSHGEQGGRKMGFNDFLEWTGLRAAHDTWRAFRGLKDGRGITNAQQPVTQQEGPPGSDQGLRDGTGGIPDFMGCPGGGIATTGGNVPDGHPGDRSHDTGHDRGIQGRPDFLTGHQEPVSSEQPWDHAIDSLPVDPSQDMDSLRGVIQAIAGLPDLERGRALQALKDRCRGYIPAGSIESEIRGAMSRARAERVEGRDQANVLDGLCFLENDNKYYRFSNGAVMNPMALDSTYGHLEFWGDAGPNGEPARIKASQAFDRRSDKLIAQGLGWKPTPDQLIHLGNSVLANTYQPPTLQPIPGDVSGWLWLGEALFGEYWYLVLGWLAYTIQHPEKKLRWQLLIIGIPRIGKTSVFYPLLVILARAALSIGNDDIANGWGDAFYQIKLLLIEEILQTGNREFFNALKPKLSNSGLEILNIKGRPTVIQENLVSMIMCTNHLDAIHFDENDEKLLVLEAAIPIEDKDEREKWFNAFYDWIDHGQGANHIYHYLLNYDLTGFQPGRLPVKTPAYYKACRAGRPDYQRYLTDLMEEETGPFMSKVVTTAVIKAALQAAGYNRGGDRGISKLMQEEGFVSVRGQKKIDGKVLTTPKFWTREKAAEGWGGAEVYDWYVQNLSGVAEQ